MIYEQVDKNMDARRRARRFVDILSGASWGRFWALSKTCNDHATPNWSLPARMRARGVLL